MSLGAAVRRGAFHGAALAALLSVTACAWTNRQNRPVWNAFEDTLVPEDETAFYLALPLTIPGGLIAIVVDTLVAHPIQVLDDAGDDAIDLWRDLDWEDEYYTELGFVPLRVIGTPIVFVGSFLGRSMFDIRDPEPVDTASQPVPREVLLEWLADVAAGDEGRYRGWRVEVMDDEIAAAIADTLERATAMGRRRVYQLIEDGDLPPSEGLTATTGLRDADPVVRYLVLRELSAGTAIEPELLDALRNDASEAVRQLAARIAPR